MYPYSACVMSRGVGTARSEQANMVVCTREGRDGMFQAGGARAVVVAVALPWHCSVVLESGLLPCALAARSCYGVYLCLRRKYM